MRKLKLEIDALSVESFEAEKAPEGEGTVFGHYPTPWCTGEGVYNTCDFSCGGQFASCVATCQTCGGYVCMEPYTGPEWTEYYQDTICVAG